MLLQNAELLDDNFNLVRADLAVSGERIARISPDLPGDGMDLTGCLIVPGFVDLHLHGCAGADLCDGTREAVARMAGHLITEGITSFCPATMTVSPARIRAALSAAKDCMEHPPAGASVRGVNLEGPYISPRRKGSQKEQFVRLPDWKEFQALNGEYGGVIKLVDMAPEREGGMEFIEHVSPFCRVSLAHSEADYEQAKEAFRRGISHVTHLFNAMTGFHHREPGAVGAVFDDDRVRAELICDGFHIHPAVLRTAFRLLGEDRTVIVSDSMRAAGMPDGVSELGGQKVFVQNGKARLADGTIAGSTTNLYSEVKNLLHYGIPLRQVIKSATLNPAKEIGADREIGSIREGKLADLVVLDRNRNLVLVIKAGKVAADFRGKAG